MIIHISNRQMMNNLKTVYPEVKTTLGMAVRIINNACELKCSNKMLLKAVNTVVKTCLPLEKQEWELGTTKLSNKPDHLCAVLKNNDKFGLTATITHMNLKKYNTIELDLNSLNEWDKEKIEDSIVGIKRDLRTSKGLISVLDNTSFEKEINTHIKKIQENLGMNDEYEKNKILNDIYTKWDLDNLIRKCLGKNMSIPYQYNENNQHIIKEISEESFTDVFGADFSEQLNKRTENAKEIFEINNINKKEALDALLIIDKILEIVPYSTVEIVWKGEGDCITDFSICYI